MEFLASIKELIPDYAKDIRLNVDGTIARSSLEGNDAVGVALAAAYAAKASRGQIQFHEPLKTLGEFTVPVKLHKEVTAHLKVVIEKGAVAE